MDQVMSRDKPTAAVDDGWFDLSAAQRAVWLDLQTLAEPLGYQLGGWARIDQPLDLDIARQAVSLVMARHDAMRLRVDPWAPRQRVDPGVVPPVAVRDLSAADDPDAAFFAYAEAAFATILPLGDEPLFRVDLLQGGPRRWYALWRCHHLITDSISIAISLRLWTEAYNALAGETTAELSPPTSFAAKLAADAVRDATAPREADLAYWRARFEDAPELLFPRRPASEGSDGGPTSEHWEMSGTAYTAYAAACRGCGVTTQRGLLALLAVFLARFHGRRDVALGVALHRRDFANRELVGMLAGLLPLRCAADPAQSIGDLVHTIGVGIDADFRHQRISLDVLSRALGRRPGAGSQLFDVVVSHVVDDRNADERRAGGLLSGAGGLFRGPETMPLALYVNERPREASIGFELSRNAQHLDAPACRRLADGFSRLIQAFIDDPFLPLDEFEPLDADERALVVSGWNATEMAFGIDTLPALFAGQVGRSPDAEAVSDGGRVLSYAALDAASDALAAVLQARGVGPEVVVGVALHRSAETIIAALAVLKAGGVYLPLDPAYPPGRLAFMLGDAGARLVMTSDAVAGSLPDDVARLVVGDVPAGGVPRPVALSAENLAYIVYTSGSTGTPKGVAVSHRAAANLAFARRAGHDPIGPGDRVLAAISVGFDVSIGQLLLPLLSGACVVIAPDLRTLSASEFWALIAGERVSHINSVPSFLASVLDEAPSFQNGPGLALSRLMLGGEALSGDLCRRLAAALPGTQVINMYGPTEACIDATAHVVSEADFDLPVLPIGRPLANDRAYVLDARLRPVPPGVAGTLFLAGAGLARGYVGQPGLTAARFVADPFDGAGGRMYDTGDRALWRADGTLVFLGRTDAQVKIRGFRVEPGEIEAALRSHPEVSQAAVIARDGRLIAYVVPAVPADLRAWLGGRLPSHMVPAAFVALAALPLTPNGKLDHRALPAPDADEAAAGRVAPVGERETLLAAIFAELTGATSVGRDDGFFALGGDSIGAIRLVSLARSRGNLSIQVRDIFAHPTPAALALVAVEAADDLASQVPASGPLPPTPLQQALITAGAPIGRFNQTVALHPPAGLSPERFAAALRRLLREHAALRLRLAPDGTMAIEEEAPEVELIQLDRDDAAAFADAVRTLCDGFDLAAGRVVRALWAAPAGGAPTIVLAVHHFAVDGVSWRILLEDLAVLTAQADLEQVVLPPPSLSLRGWTAHLHEQALARAGELPVWQAMLAGDAATLPVRPAAAANTIGAARSLSRVLPTADAARLLAAPAIYRAEINDVLLAALGLALAAWQGAPAHVVAVEGHGREAGETGLDLTRTVGWFTSLFPVRLDLAGLDITDALAGGAAAGEAIKRVKAALRGLPDHGLGYGLLRHLNPGTAPVLAALPAPAILFNYLGRFSHAAATGEDQWRPAALPASPADDADRSRDPTLLEANALLDGEGALHVNWSFAPCLDEAGVATLADGFLDALVALARHCAERPLPPVERLIPADFPLAQAAGLDDALLADLAAAAPDLEAVLPLTPLQRGLAFETLLRGGGADPYHVQAVLRLEGAIDPVVLREAWATLTRRHEVLRLAVPERALGAGLGILRPAASWRDVDWRGLADVDAQLQQLLSDDLAQGFDFGQGPLARLTLIRTGATTAILLLSNHHALLDGWSMPVLVGELLRLARGVTLPPTLPWSAVLDWQARRDRVAAQDFWARAFNGASPDAGALLPPPPRAGERGVDHRYASLSAETTGAIERFARRHGLTMATVALGAWALILRPLRARVETDDLVIGMTSGGRPATLPGADFAVGLFIQTLPLRLTWRDDAALVEWLHALQTATAAQEEHGWLGLPAIRQAAKLGSDRPLFEALFVFENYPVDASAGSEAEPLRVAGVEGRDATHYPLAMAAMPAGEVMRLRLTFDRALVDGDGAEALVARMAALLGTIAAAEPSVTLDAVPLLDADERALVVSEWNATEMAFGIDTLPALFAAQVGRSPAAEAVSDGGRVLSYAALAAASDALAAVLQARGVGPEVVVGVALHRSAETIIAALAVLKAGGVYLPLDPAYPPGRLAFMLADAGARLVMTSDAVAGSLPDDVARLVVGDVPAGGVPRPVALSAENVAYIVYTSGSTGTPKGVAVSHRAAANLAFARRAGHDPIGPGDRVLAAISVGFDVSIGQLLLPLLSGACVVIAPDLRTLSASEFWALIAGERVSHINSVPSFLASVLDEVPSFKNGPGLVLRRLMLGGEALSGDLCRRLAAALPGTQVINMYGPTEACIDATAHVVSEADFDLPVLPIGRPLANDRAYVLDARLRPVPPGVAGTLFLAGAGLARGYVGQPGLTAARFVANPFEDGRMYDTGDRALWRADGTLVFLGRTDAQVKIRGFRVEPGEIEAALRSHPEISQAAVIARDGRLIAYVVPAVPADLRAWLGGRLPSHMVPAAFVALAALPLTPNGKLDHRALPAPDADEAAAERVAPVGERETLLAAIFAELLGVPAVGATDDFFDLGGHSLLATRLVSRVRADFGVDLPLRTVFAAPTVRGLATAIGAGAASGALTIAVGARPARLPLSFSQERLWFLEQLDPGAQIYVMPAVLRLTGALDAALLDRALRQVVARHESLRTRFTVNEGVAAQIIDEAVEISIDVEDCSQLSPAAQEAAVRAAAAGAERARFDLQRGPLLRAGLLRLSAERHVLVLAVHHIVSDGWSMGVLLRELTTLYAAFARGLPDPLPPLPIQYADFALWQRQHLSGAELDRLVAFWRGALAGAPGLLDLPTDRPRPASPSLRGGWVGWRAAPTLAARLRERARGAEATPFMLLLTAFQALLARWSGQRDLVVGTPIAQRTSVETEQLIGFFVNTLALRADFSAGPRFSDALAQARETVVSAFAHQDLPFEQLVDAVQPERDLGRQPIVQTMFVLQNMPMDGGIPGLRIEPVEVPVTVAKFDLTLSLAEEADGGLSGGFEYATDLFDAATIERLGGWFSRLLTAIADDPGFVIDDFDLLGADERALVVSEWNATEMAFGIDTLPALFAAQVGRSPAAEAVSDGGRVLSYAALAAASDALAAELQARGVGPEVVVGVALHRSAETIIAALAVLKAGGVYLPLDPAYPPGRLAFMLADAGARLVMTSDAVAGSLPDDVARLVVGDVPAGGVPRPVALSAENLAYIVYTSGSTGTPKGVAVSHRAAANLAFARRAGHDPIGPGDRVLAAISVGFDVSIGQLLLPLLSGACVVIAPDLRTLSASEFWALIAGERVSHINSVPSFLASVLDEAPSFQNGPGLALRRLMLGGEALSGDLCRRLAAALPGTQVINMYGPTEACIDATAHVVSEADFDLPVLPIGRPLANDRAYVLDARLRPVPPGVAGTLFLAGAGLARGYVGQPGLTAARFVADPFDGAGGRMYDTGDRALWRADGTLVFLGRTDAQVKIRGFRVEPGEIEAALRSHPEVSQAAVIARDGRLIAYVVPAVPADLRAWLGGRLPSHMVPAAFVALAALPLTPNGKLDHRALPAPDADEAAAERVAPRDEIETALLAAWKSVLGLAEIGVQDDFFLIGGDSLAAIRLVGDCNAALGVTLPVAGLFAHRTIEAMAAAIRSGRGSRLVTLQQGRDGEPPLVCVHPVGGTTLCYGPLVGALPVDLPVLGLDASGLNENESLASSVEAMAADYVAALRRQHPAGPYRLAGYSIGGVVAFEMARQLMAAGETVRFVALLDTLDPGREDVARLSTEAAMVAALAEEIGLPPQTTPPATTLELYTAAQDAGMVPPDFTLAQAERIVGVHLNNARIAERYRPAVALPVPILLVRATARDGAPPDWTRFAGATIDTVDFDCTHAELVSDDMAPPLAAAIGRYL